MITGTVPSTSYTLTANPISNTVYPHIVAGTPVTLALSGSSNPSGDSLQFSIDSPPTLGTLGPITQVDADDATVVYTPPALSCPDPNGVSGFLCSDTFTFTVHDAEGNASSPAKVDLDVLPGGAGNEVPAVTAPPTESYTTLSQNGNLVPAADLTGSVTVGPSNFPDEIQLALQASSGTIDLANGVASGVTFLNGTANDEATIYLAGSLTKLNTAIGQFLYFPPAGTTPTATIHMFPTDMGPTGGGPFTAGTEVTTTINGIVHQPAPVHRRADGGAVHPDRRRTPHVPFGRDDRLHPDRCRCLPDDPGRGDPERQRGSLALPASDTSGPTPWSRCRASGTAARSTSRAR